MGIDKPIHIGETGWATVSNGFYGAEGSQAADEYKSKKYYVYCAGGYRSMIACSLMKKNGFSNVVDVYGGFTEIKKINSNITEL